MQSILVGLGKGGRTLTDDSGTPWPLAAASSSLPLVLVEMRDQPVDQIAGAGMRDVAHDRRDVDDAYRPSARPACSRRNTPASCWRSVTRWVRRCNCGSCCRPPLRGAPCRWCPRPGPPRRQRSCGLAVARGDLHAGVEIDDVLPPRRRVPVEVVSRRDLAEDDPARRQAFRQFAAARLLDPFDLDVPEVRLAARHRCRGCVSASGVSPSRLASRRHTSGGAEPGASPLDYAPRRCCPTMLVAAPARNQPPRGARPA